MRSLLGVCSLALMLLAGVAAAAPDVPTPAHPRLLLDAGVRDAWKQQAARRGTPVARAMERCTQIQRSPRDLGRDHYMGLDWAGHLQNCLVAWAATGKDAYADTAMTYFTAMLDDLEVVGDGKGGDNAARRDSGFAIRAMGPYTALAYDWLHDHPRMTEPLRARARQRFEAWTTWYLASGYRARSPGTNYHAGYLVAATFIAIAQNGEAGKAGNDLWRLVRDELWGKDMAKALGPGGVLDGGDWGEGWQYGPLSVAEYAIAARAMAQQGAAPPGVRRWLDALLRRSVHALSPGASVFVGGDTDHAHANLPPSVLPLAAVLIGDASDDAKAWAAHEIERLGLAADDTARQFALYTALATAAPVEATPVPRGAWPSYYLAAGTSTFYTRSQWGKDAVWTVLQCSKAVDVDHMHPDAGNLVVSRGADDLVVDPSPYGTLSSLTGNAPTVESAQLPAEYKPSQAFWGEKTGFTWAHQTTSGVVAARCDYADQYKFQHRPSDVPAAQRDVVVFPWDDGKNALVVVVDRARSGDQARGLHLRFRTQATLAAEGGGVRGVRGASSITVRRVASSGGSGSVRAMTRGDCFSGATRGGCDLPRFPINEWTMVVPGPTMEAIHTLDAAPARSRDAATPPARLERQGAVAVLSAVRGAGTFVVAMGGTAGGVSYRASAGTHAVLDGPADAVISARAADDGCTVTVGAGGDGTRVPGRPAVFRVDDGCTVHADPLQRVGASGGGAIDAGASGASGGAAADASAPADDGSIGTPSGTLPRSARSGCCGAQATPGSPLAAATIVLLWCLLPRRRRVRARV